LSRLFFKTFFSKTRLTIPNGKGIYGRTKALMKSSKSPKPWQIRINLEREEAISVNQPSELLAKFRT
jgi:hypothetical protein